jgi:hypothetical protein
MTAFEGNGIVVSDAINFNFFIASPGGFVNAGSGTIGSTGANEFCVLQAICDQGAVSPGFTVIVKINVGDAVHEISKSQPGDVSGVTERPNRFILVPPNTTITYTWSRNTGDYPSLSFSVVGVKIKNALL